MFEWQKILFGEEEWLFIPEVLLRTAVMFVFVLIALRILGKRGVRQLSVFELVVIITMGSAAGDPMFYKDVGIVPALGVFVVVVSFYYLVTYLVGKSKRFETLIEGKPVCLIENGMFSIENFKKESLAKDEFFAELRVRGVSQLGQIEQAIIETNGDVSVIFFEDKLVKPGLPILPGEFIEQKEKISEPGVYSCSFCGNTRLIEKIDNCERCHKSTWVKASVRRRVG